MVSRDRIVSALDIYLDVDQFKDYAPIGLQVEGAAKVTGITLGVSACMALFEKAVLAGSQIVVVHHGMFWKNDSSVLKGPLRERVRFLLDHDLTLLGYHLPLDAHPTVGNNARLIRQVGAVRTKPWGVYDGTTVGYIGTFKRACPLNTIVKRLSNLTPDAPAVVLDHGPAQVKRFGVVSGGGGSVFAQAVEEKLDLYLTGESYEPAQALCREAGINFVGLGHHNSEKVGVMALAGWLKKKFKIKAAFVDIANPA